MLPRWVRVRVRVGVRLRVRVRVRGVCGERPILVFKVDPSHPDAAQVG